jgi:maleylacetate reductase
MRRIAAALNATDAPQGVYDLARRNGAPTSLKDIGMPVDGLDHAADLAVKSQYPNPRPLERTALRALLQRAFEGVAPHA